MESVYAMWVITLTAISVLSVILLVIHVQLLQQTALPVTLHKEKCLMVVFVNVQAINTTIPQYSLA